MMPRQDETPGFVTNVAVEALGGGIAAIVTGSLGRFPAILGLVAGAVLAGALEPHAEAAVRRRMNRRRVSPAEMPGGTGVAAAEPKGGVTRPSRWRRLSLRTSLLVTATAIVSVVITFTAIELARGGESVIGDRGGTFVPLPTTVTVPSVDGLPASEARRQLEAVDLDAKPIRTFDRTVGAGFVIRSDPTSGERVETGTSVTLLVSRGPGVLVPSVGGMALADAQAALDDANLVARQEPRFHETIAIGVVIGSDPASGKRVEPRTTVSILVSRGPRAIVPDVEGLSLAEAEAALQEANLVASPEPTFHETIPAGVVIRSDPGSGQQVESATVVTVFVSRGRPVDVPDLAGMSLADALAALEKAELIAEQDRTIHATVPADVVIDSDPAGGTQVARGTAVTIHVSLGPGVEIPALERDTFDEAQAKLTNLGLVAVQALRVHDLVPKGEVIGSDPPRGARIEPGASVTVFVSLGPAVVSPPQSTVATTPSQ